MNFEKIRTIIDQKGEKGYSKTLPMLGEIKEFKGEGITESSGKPWKKVSIKDDAGELHNVTLRGTLPDATMVDKRAQFNLCSFNGSFQPDGGGETKTYIGYSGFWDSKAQTSQDTPATAPSSAQGGQAVNQAQSAKKEASPIVWDAEESIRGSVLCAMIQSGNEVMDYELILKHTQFIMTGKTGNFMEDLPKGNPAGRITEYQGEQPTAPDDGGDPSW